MTTDQIILFALFAGVFILLVWGRIRYDVVAFAALMLAVILGVVPAADAFSGFGHPATLIVALVLVVSAGLVRSGAVHLITRTLVDSARPLGRHIAVMGGIGASLSAFMNNVAALALLMPIDIQTARKAGRAPGLSLMPLSFATILGGMVTLIGTPPNIIVASIREDTLGTPFRMFDFAPVGALTAVAGLLFVALLGWRLIPRREDAATAGATAEEFASYIAELSVPEGSPLIGEHLSALEETAEKNDVALLGLERRGERRRGLARSVPLQAGDVLVIEAAPEALDEFRTTAGLDFTDDPKREKAIRAEGGGLVLGEVVVPEGARIAGKTAEAVGLGWRQRTVLLGIARQGVTIRTRIRKTRIRPGDILLLLLPEETEADVIDWLGCLQLADRGRAVTPPSMTWIAIMLFAGAVAAASFGLLPLAVALGVVVVGYALTRIVPLSELYTHIQWPVVVLLGSMIPLGAALESSGGTALIAEGLTGLTEGLPVWAVLLALMLGTMILSDILNNAATAIVAAPVGIDMAARLGVNPDPFLMTVAIAASCAFLTPIGHQNNTLILGPGGYRFSDYWPMGLALQGVILAVSIPAILIFWPL